MYRSGIGTALKSSGNTAVAISLGRGAIENGKALALRLRKNLARGNCVHEGGVNHSLINHSLILFCCSIEHLRGDINEGADGAINSASCAVAAIISSKYVARAAESIRVEGAHWSSRDNNVEQAAFALLKRSTWACHTAAV